MKAKNNAQVIENINEINNNSNIEAMNQNGKKAATSNATEIVNGVNDAPSNESTNNTNMEEGVEMATQNATISEVDNNNNKTKNMKQIDFSYGVKSTVEDRIIDDIPNATVNLVVVQKIYRAFLNIPTNVTVGFKYVENKLLMIVRMTHKDKITQEYTTFADFDLVEAMVNALGMRIEALPKYCKTEHTVEATKEDLRIELFRQFLNSPNRCYFSNDFVSSNNERYVCATFSIGFKKEVRFCLKRNEEVEKMISQACKPANSIIED